MAEHHQSSWATGTAVHATCTLLLLVGVSHLQSSLTSEARASYIHTCAVRRPIHLFPNAAEPRGSFFAQISARAPVPLWLLFLVARGASRYPHVRQSSGHQGYLQRSRPASARVLVFRGNRVAGASCCGHRGAGDKGNPITSIVPVVPPQTCNV